MFLTRISYTDLSDRSRTDPYPATCRRLSTFNRMPAALPAPPHKSAHKAEHTTAEFTQQHQLQHRPFLHGPFLCHMPSSFQGPSHVLRFPYTLQTFLTRTSYTDLSDPSRTDPGFFLRTHPDSALRCQRIKGFSQQNMHVAACSFRQQLECFMVPRSCNVFSVQYISHNLTAAHFSFYSTLPSWII